ncbi:accessory factor UbiK family protein [Roseomonas elaeocarpi]|uniref:Accessory factor UbiK family protein n=1 Tax=Roseomonas elaeocarpi TaxID=907779 RepID=A0ABV6JUZ1_9PROT
MDQDRGFGSGFGGFGGGPREGAGTGSGAGGGFGGGFGRGSKLFDDLAGVAGGAFSALTGIRNEAEAAFRAQAEGVLQRLDLVRREDLDAAMELARRAREENEGLAMRVAVLEKLVATMVTTPAPTGSGTTGPAPAQPAEPVPGKPAPGASVADPDTLGGSGGSSETEARPNPTP